MDIFLHMQLTLGTMPVYLNFLMAFIVWSNLWIVVTISGLTTVSRSYYTYAEHTSFELGGIERNI